MSQYLNWSDQVEAYVADELNLEEKAAFEAAMQRDASLVEEVQAAREAVALLGLYTQIAYKEQLQAFDAELEASKGGSQKPQGFPWRRAWLSIAASVLILVASVYLVMRSRYDNQSLQHQAFEPYQNVLSMRGDQGLTPIMESYEAGEYASFVQEMNAYLSGNPEPEPLARLYLGIAYLGEGEANQAETILSQLTGNPTVSAQAEWYLSLAVLAQDEETTARQLLQNIQSQPTHPHQADATQLLQQLDSVWR